ncbi:CorA family divalent cation transporter [Pseudooceanicola sp. HF7]|uniref:CorA family divalent cation transporter n=1 Tax=Pseudooceanicola sp. HF7 TaxID=2721560 RepID=UPI00142FB164|nr:CorA family divalent cation transporter [Pseudooceanicola sp. HF7]NIZ08194.1 zinc transporter ZntB [Pseudooceanicola sp. HF7]
MSDCIHCAYILEGPEKGRSLDSHLLGTELKGPAVTWAHLDDKAPDVRDWLAENLPFLEDWVLDALAQPNAHSRATTVGEGLFIVLRSINVNDGADPLDMLALRIWADKTRIVTLSSHPIDALDEVTHQVAHGDAPSTPGAFIAAIVRRLADRLEPAVLRLEDRVGELEEKVVNAPDPALRRNLAELRLDVVKLRRHAPSQKDALLALLHCDSKILAPVDRREIAENQARISRLSDSVDQVRDSLVVLRDDLSGQLEDRLNRHMYTLALVSAIFLPLMFVTGLLGINVDGIPGARSVDSFWVVTGGLVLFAGFLVAILRWFHWME